MTNRKTIFLTFILLFAVSLPLLPQARGLSGMIAEYYDEPHFGDFVIAKPFEGPIDFYLSDWGGAWPYDPLKLTPELEDGSAYSVLWLGKLQVPETGFYTFRLAEVDDGGYVIIDGVMVTDLGWNYPYSDRLGTPQTVYLDAGEHDIRIAYEQRIHYIGSFEVRWSGPSFAEEVIPNGTGSGDLPELFFAATHIHSDYSDGKLTVSELLEKSNSVFSGYGGSLAITDHIAEDGGDVPWVDPAFERYLDVYPVRAEEWGHTSYVDPHITGHATIFNIDDSSDDPILVKDVAGDQDGFATEATYNTMLTEARARGAFVWANHPTNAMFPWAPGFRHVTRDNNGDGDYYDAGDWVHGIEGRMVGTEVWSNLSVNYWQGMLETGLRKVVGIAASDYHSNKLGKFDQPISMVMARSNTPADIADAIAAGRVIMMKSSTAPYVIISADADGDGTDETMMGDTITTTGSKTVTFTVTVSESKKNLRLYIYTSSGNEVIKCGTGEPWNYTFTRTVTSAADFVRVELRKNKFRQSMTNPIYINID